MAPVSSRSMNRGVWLLCGLAVMTTLAACGGGSTEAQPSTSIPVQTTVSAEMLTQEAPADQEVQESTMFVSPSSNIGCLLDPAYVRCDISENNWSPPPKPAECDLEWGESLSIRSGEPAGFVCHGDTVFGAQKQLQYGESINAGVMRCDSAETGITCRDIQTGHGFSLSREAYRLF